ENAMQTIMNVIESIRSIRGEMNVAPSREVEILINAPSPENRDLLEIHLEDYLPSFTRISNVSIAETLEKPSACATAVVDDLTIYVPLAGVIDINAERSRLRKRLGKLTADLVATKKTLDNPHFVERAPEAVVMQKQDLLTRFESEREKLESNLNMLE
ncbi:MAG: valine--tRNA ligase, partial [Candidatus Poribacteria bacterium]|nr:valine--tRNA ligase [Candidatus Poribacteria bacterium]